MAEETTYYAIVNELGSRDKPRGVVRRIKHEGGLRDEAFGRDLTWGHTTLLASAERGDTMNDFYEIAEEEAMRIAERIRREAGPPSDAAP
jgi:hypothetical protein